MSQQYGPYGSQDAPSAYPSAPQGAGYGYETPAPAAGTLASWGQRAGAYLLDALLSLAISIPGIILIGIGAASAAKTSSTDAYGNTSLSGGGLGVALFGYLYIILASVVFALWYLGYRQGVKGNTWGKSKLGLRLVSEANGGPIGGGAGVARMLLRAVWGFIPVVGSLLSLLWPLWDEKRQTWEDKVIHSVVVKTN